MQIANICDGGYLGPHSSIQAFSPLLKLKSENRTATILMLFLNAASETERANKGSAKQMSDMKQAMRRLDTYLPLGRTQLGQITSADDLARHPGFVSRSSCHDMFKDWEYWFNLFFTNIDFERFLHYHGLAIRKQHLIVEPWPYKIRAHATKDEFNVLRASGFIGYERYIELQRQSNEDEA